MRTLVYPYDEDFEVVIKYGDFIDTMEISEILSPVGWGLQNKKVGENIQIKTNINAVNWEQIDALLLIDTIRSNLHIDEILEVVKLSAKFVKKIILNRDMDKELYTNIVDICSNEKVELIDVRKQAQLRVSDNNQLKAIYTPVIIMVS